jgi:hypothetical protein
MSKEGFQYGNGRRDRQGGSSVLKVERVCERSFEQNIALRRSKGELA